MTFAHENALKIFGPAGAGKTRELVRILQEHVEDGDFQLLEGVIISFTRAAAHDIARRVNPDGGPGRYHCTIHALCKRYHGFDGELAEPHLSEFFREQGIQYRAVRSPDPEDWVAVSDGQRSEGALLLAFWNWARNRMLELAEARRLVRPDPEVEHWWVGDAMDRLWQAYRAWKAERDYTDFTDMLEYSIQNPPQGWWPFLVLDEAQDCTPLQWAVVQGFARQADVVYLAGDDDQALYSWSGATPREFLDARTTGLDILHVNHRSGGVIVQAAQAFIRRNRDRQDKSMVATREDGVIESLAAGELPEVDVRESTFVMARAHYLNEPMLEALTRAGVPFEDVRGSWGVHGQASLAYQRFLWLATGKAMTIDEWRLLADSIPSRGPWLTLGTKKRLAQLDGDFRAETYVRLDGLGAYGATEDCIGAIRSRDVAVLGRLDQERLGYLREVQRRFGVEMLDPARARQVCRVGSIHAFKGLECDRAIVHGGMPPRAMREAFADPEPERRVIYVAMTRPRNRLTHYTTGPAHRWDEVL